MKKFLTTVAVLTVFATPAFAQSFDPDNGTGNVLSFGVCFVFALPPESGHSSGRAQGALWA
jgi:hypothetical protein